MTGHDLSAGGDVMDRVRGCAQDALAAYDGISPAASVELLNVSENATFLVSDPDTGPSVLRVHRLGYHTEQEIASELAWMDALRAEAGVRTPRVLPAADGRRVVTVPEAGGAAERHCVRFEFLPGTEPGAGPADDPVLTAAHFVELGEITARMHRHAREWSRPAWFTRFHWDYPAAFGDQARWGRWQDGIGVGPHLVVVARREPAHDALAIEHDGGRARYVLAFRPTASVQQPVTPGHGQVGVAHEAIAEAEPLGQSLALLVAIG